MKKARILFRIIGILLTDPRLTASFLKNVVYVIYLRITKKKLVVIALTEQLGDIVAAEPVNAFLKKEHPGSFICRVIGKKYSSLAKADPAISAIITVTCFSEWILLKYFLPSKSIVDLHINEKGCSRHHLVNVKANPFNITIDNYFDKGNLLHAFSRSAGIEMPDDIPPVLHFSLKDTALVTGKYMILHTSANNPEKMWRKKCWNELARFILANFDGYSVVEIGFEKNITDTDSRIIDMTGEKELAYIASIINTGSLFIGVDSGFAHFANALNKDAIIIIGAMGHFKEYMPYSGKFSNERKDTILYYHGQLSEMPCTTVFDFLIKKTGHSIS